MELKGTFVRCEISDATTCGELAFEKFGRFEIFEISLADAVR